MSVSNVKVAFIRPRYNNLKEWCEDENNVYIGRKGIVFVDNERFPKNDSIWCNPYKVGKDGNLDEVLEKYKYYIVQKIHDENLFQELYDLRDKNLGCWCVNKTTCETDHKVCHGQILLEFINEIVNEVENS